MSLENFKNRKIEWDTINKNFDQSVQVISGDVNSRTLTIVITDNGDPIDLTGYSVKLIYKYIYNDISGFVMLTPIDAKIGEFSLTIPTEMTAPGSIKSNLILLNENLEQVIVSKNLKFISDDSTVTDLAQEVNSKIDDFTKLLLENMPQVMRSELDGLHAQTDSNTSNIELKANLADMASLQSAMTDLKNEVEAFGITPENLVTIKSLLDAITGILSDLSQKGFDISDLKTKMDTIYSNALDDHAEIETARGVYDTLPNRLQAIDGMLISKLNSLTNISPKDVVESFAVLVSMHPTGSDGVFITADTGHWYFWNGNSWEDGGAYQSPMPADFVKSTYLSRALRNIKKVKSNLNLLLFLLNNELKMVDTTISEESITVSPGGYCFPFINLASASDIYLTFHNPNHPERIKIAIKSYVGTIIKRFDLKGSSIDGIYYADLNEYLAETSNPEAFIEIRMDNRGMSDNLTIDKFLVGKGGIPISVNDSLFNSELDFIRRTISVLKTVPTNLSILTRVQNTTREYLATFEGNSITIDASGYAFMTLPVAKAKDVYLTLSQVNHPDRLSFRIKNVSTGVTGKLPFESSVVDDIYYLDFNDYLSQSTTPATDEFEIRLDNRNKTDQLVISQFLIGRGGLPTGNTTTTDKTVYVDTKGAYKTIQSAIDSGATNIFVKPGIYKESISVGGRDALTISSMPESDYNITSKPDTQGVVIDMTTTLELISDDTIFSMAETVQVGSRLEKTFISKSLPLVISGRSDGYNVTLWEDTGDIKTSKRLVPVATQTECKSTQGTFTFDGTKIWVNPFEGTVSGKTFKLLDDISDVASFTDVANLTLSGLKFIGGYGNAIRMNKVIKFDFVRVEASRSALGNGFSCDNSNGTFTSCTANQNRNDGFNFHSFGDTHLIDCEGHYNLDDGNSHHDGTTGTIVRGEWSHNSKGGCSPTYGSIIHIDSVYSHDNAFGIYLDTLPENPLRTVRHTNCVLKNNTASDYLIGGKYNILGVNNLYTTKTGSGAYTKLN